MSKTKSEEVVIEVSDEEYLANLKSGLRDDEILRPGRHVFVRGGFLKRHGLKPEDLKNATVRLTSTVHLDHDLYEYFSQKAEGKSGEQVINETLRVAMEREHVALSPVAVELIENPKFIEALSSRLTSFRQPAKNNRRRKAA